jgi:hypothetical protein
MSINLNVFLELVGLVSFTDSSVLSRNLVISMSYYVFSTPKSAILTEWQIGASVSFNPWVIYAMTSSMDMNESAVNMHMEFTILY